MTQERPRRTRPSVTDKLNACLYLLGLDPNDVEWDHSPPLALRPVNDAGTDYVPPQRDPRHLVPLSRSAHKLKTTGRMGESRLSITGNGDVSIIRKSDRLANEHANYRARLLAKEPGKPRQKSGSIPSRPFPKNKRPFRSGGIPS